MLFREGEAGKYRELQGTGEERKESRPVPNIFSFCGGGGLVRVATNDD